MSVSAFPHATAAAGSGSVTTRTVTVGTGGAKGLILLGYTTVTGSFGSIDSTDDGDGHTIAEIIDRSISGVVSFRLQVTSGASLGQSHFSKLIVDTDGVGGKVTLFTTNATYAYASGRSDWIWSNTYWTQQWWNGDSGQNRNVEFYS